MRCGNKHVSVQVVSSRTLKIPPGWASPLERRWTPAPDVKDNCLRWRRACKYKDLSSVASVHIGSQSWWPLLRIPRLGEQKQPETWGSRATVRCKPMRDSVSKDKVVVSSVHFTECPGPARLSNDYSSRNPQHKRCHHAVDTFQLVECLPGEHAAPSLQL